ncbi:hypothetical protein RY831_13025 [Noviherbaspirillum sp. CPCC 100848]|uniref:Lipoprotein n=1 Tax=Noviherbaspirillum album TaxID=3080276 RepID=A0ABU6J8X7_9BURK|nr:hypothetical protein [Noviherbaspirillum sp. CPCC 100848]MEC4720079.1 hypothetical protein [Noviherbaspirillum sp. CPCC 100848]
MTHNNPQFRLSLLSLACMVLIAGCGGGSGGEGDGENHSNATIDTAGRIVVSDSGSNALRVHDLDSGSVEATHQLDHPPSGLNASPGGRYAVALQGTQNQVQFIDGGIWQEDHGDHDHDYKNASRLLSWKLAGPRPSHYDVQAGRQASIFFDGNGNANPIQAASMRLINDASIAAGNTLAALNLQEPIHGFAEPLDNKLLSVHRASDATDTLPTHLNLYLRSGATYTSQRLLPTRCNGMHGSYTSGSYTAVGCADGVLLARHVSATDVTDQKISTPTRISTLVGHPKAPGQFIGFGNSGTAPAPVTTVFYSVDGERAAATPITPTGWTAGSVQRAHGFDRSGNRFYILDNRGTLIVMTRTGNTWNTSATIASAVPAMPAAAPWPTITANGARDEIYITDPAARQLVVLNTQTSTITARRDLGYAPSNALWVGISR